MYNIYFLRIKFSSLFFSRKRKGPVLSILCYERIGFYSIRDEGHIQFVTSLAVLPSDVLRLYRITSGS